MRLLRRYLPSPAMVVACLALLVALGGTSYAAIKLPRNSVGNIQLKRGAVTGDQGEEQHADRHADQRVAARPGAVRSLGCNSG